MTPDEMKAAVELAKTLAECCRAWSPDVRLIGNLRADEIERVATALLAAQAECERMRQVYEAAIEWFHCDEDREDHDRIETRLLVAINAARTAAGGEG